jgi:hypothetical protein
MKTFERNASVAPRTDIQDMSSEKFLQYSGDSVDHNICCVDGKWTFHGMRMITMVTPVTKQSPSEPRVFLARVV